MVFAARYVYLGMVWLYVAGLLLQVFLAGIGIFGVARDFAPHVGLGWLLHLVPILLLIVAAVARVGSRLIWWNVALLVVQFVQPIFALARKDTPVLAAFHPVLALVVFWLAVTVGLKAWRLVREPSPVAA